MMVGVHAAPRQIAFERSVAGGQQAPSEGAKGFAFETPQQGGQLGILWSGDDDGARCRLAVGDAMAVAEVAHPAQMAEKVKRPGFGLRQGWQNAAPDAR